MSVRDGTVASRQRITRDVEHKLAGQYVVRFQRPLWHVVPTWPQPCAAEYLTGEPARELPDCVISDVRHASKF